MRIRRVAEAYAEHAQEDHGGWVASMIRELGNSGTLRGFAGQGAIVSYDDGGEHCWNPALLEPLEPTAASVGGDDDDVDDELLPVHALAALLARSSSPSRGISSLRARPPTPPRSHSSSSSSSSAAATVAIPAAPAAPAEPEEDFGDDVPHEFLCVISCEIMQEPVMCTDGHTYGEAITVFFRILSWVKNCSKFIRAH